MRMQVPAEASKLVRCLEAGVTGGGEAVDVGAGN